MFIHWLDYGSDGTFTISLLEALIYESLILMFQVLICMDVNESEN
jgi:hypothetical protein